MRPLAEVADAARRAADVVAERSPSSGFKELALQQALAEALPGSTVETTGKPHLEGWDPGLGQFDIRWTPGASTTEMPIECKVWDVDDSLFDVLKLATAHQSRRFGPGFVVIAGRQRDWDTEGPGARLTAAEHGVLVTRWSTKGVLDRWTSCWTGIWRESSARPRVVPAAFAVCATPAIPMPLAPGHTIRVASVVAASKLRVRLDDDGLPAELVSDAADEGFHADMLGGGAEEAIVEELNREMRR